MLRYNQYLPKMILFLIALSHAEAFAGSSAPWVGVDFRGFACAGEHMRYGPYDYANAEHRATKLPIVESYHFTPEVQQLLRGKSGSVIGDLQYTLRAFPNHYKALRSISYYDILYKNTEGMNNVSPSVECYFQRAINFVPADATVHILYAIFLKKINKVNLAEAEYKKAIELEPEKLKFRYMYGLFLVKQKKYNAAKEQAEIIYNKNYPETKLKMKLHSVGYWGEVK